MKKVIGICFVSLFFAAVSLWATTIENINKETVILSGSHTEDVIINTNCDFILVLDSVEIQSETPLTITGDASNVVIFLKGTNVLIAEKTDDKKIKTGALECNLQNNICNLIFAGSGTLDISTSTKHGIHGQSIIFKEGHININLSESSSGHAIKAEDQVIVDGSEITINAMGSVPQEESKGIVVVGHESGTKVRPNSQDALCRFVMNKGILNITSVSKAITAKWKQEDGKTETIEDDPKAVVVINGGNISIKTTGILNKTEGQELSPEGIEGKDEVIINGGAVDILSTDDAINSRHIEINGGTIVAQSLMDDGIDSNGDILITGGTIIAMSDKNPSEPIDCNSGKNMTWTGGDIIAIGGVIGSLPAWHGLGLGYFQIRQNLSLFHAKTLYLLNSEKEIIIAMEIPERFKDYLRLDIFAGSDKTQGACDLVFTTENLI